MRTCRAGTYRDNSEAKRWSACDLAQGEGTDLSIRRELLLALALLPRNTRGIHGTLPGPSCHGHDLCTHCRGPALITGRMIKPALYL